MCFLRDSLINREKKNDRGYLDRESLLLVNWDRC